MANFTLDIDEKDLQAFKKLSKELRRIAPNAINRTLTATKKHTTDLILGKAKLKKKDLAKSFIIRRASNKKPEGHFSFSSRPVSLTLFKPRIVKVSTPRGIRRGVSIDMGQGREIVKGGFLAAMPSGKKGVFTRKRQTRLPIREIKLNPVTRFFGSDSQIIKGIETFARETLQATVEKDLEQFINRSDT